MWCRGRDGHSKEGHTFFKSQRPLQEICDKIYDQVLKSFTTLFFYKFLRPLNSSKYKWPLIKSHVPMYMYIASVRACVCGEKKIFRNDQPPRKLLLTEGIWYHWQFCGFVLGLIESMTVLIYTDRHVWEILNLS